MKLLSWMHRKSREDIIEPLKKISTGNSSSCLSIQPSLDERQYNSESSYSSVHTIQTKRESSRYYAVFTAKKEEETMKESPTMMSELFHGFLTIGTLGSEPSIGEPTTPKFTISQQSVDDKEKEVPETALNLISDELEKFIEAEAKDVDYDSSQRSSYVSIITLSDYQNEGGDADADADADTDTEENRNMVLRPLQEYLFSSSIECLETGEATKKEKESLGKLFEKSDKIIEQHTEECIVNEMPSKGTRAMYFVKKMLKKIHISSRSTKTIPDGDAGSVSSKRKLRKALKMLRRRIYPERSICDKDLNSSHKNKDIIRHHDRGVTILDKGDHKLLHRTKFKEATRISSYDDSLGRSHSTGKGEHWIKTDTNYLVLEL